MTKRNRGPCFPAAFPLSIFVRGAKGKMNFGCMWLDSCDFKELQEASLPQYFPHYYFFPPLVLFIILYVILD